MGQPNTRRNYTSIQDWVEMFLIFIATFRKFETETTQVSDAKWIDKKQNVYAGNDSEQRYILFLILLILK